MQNKTGQKTNKNNEHDYDYVNERAIVKGGREEGKRSWFCVLFACVFVVVVVVVSVVSREIEIYTLI